MTACFVFLVQRNEFREGLIAGRSETINPILNWLLQRREELKKRAYLSRYLVKIDIAPEMRSDSDVIDLYEQVRSKILKNFVFKIKKGHLKICILIDCSTNS